MLLGHGLSDLHRDPPRRVAVDFQVPRKLSCANALLGVEDDADP